jgi:hypothetical protein
MLATPFVLLIAACGSQSAGTFHPEGNSVAADSPAPSLPAGPVPFPGKVTFEFDSLPADPQQAAIATADRQFVLGYYYAIYTGGKSQGYASYIGDSNVRASVAANIAQQVADHRGYAGLARYFDTTVQPISGYNGEQQISYCVDESQLHHTDIRTGRVVPKGYPADHQYYLESDMLAKDKHGAWQVVGTLVTYYPNGQARECKS